MQYLEERQLGALIAALHRAAQLRLPVTLVGSGLPQLVGNVGSAKSYAERMFSFPEVGPLAADSAARALEAPAHRLGVSYASGAVDEILRLAQGYPYFLQEWGSATRAKLVQKGMVYSPAHGDTAFTVPLFDQSLKRVMPEG